VILRWMRRVVIVLLTLAALVTISIASMGCLRIPRAWHYRGKDLAVEWSPPVWLAMWRISPDLKAILLLREAEPKSLRLRIDRRHTLPRASRRHGVDLWICDIQWGDLPHSRRAGSSYTTLLSIGMRPWLLFVLFGTYPLIAFVRPTCVGYARALRGRCVKCAYSLRGLPGQGGSDPAATIAHRTREQIGFAMRQFGWWSARGAIFGALAPLVHFGLRVQFPEWVYLDSSLTLRLIAFPGEWSPVKGYLAVYLVGILLYAVTAGTCALAWTLYRSRPVAKARVSAGEEESNDGRRVRCPECGTDV